MQDQLHVQKADFLAHMEQEVVCIPLGQQFRAVLQPLQSKQSLLAQPLRVKDSRCICLALGNQKERELQPGSLCIKQIRHNMFT